MSVNSWSLVRSLGIVCDDSQFKWGDTHAIFVQLRLRHMMWGVRAAHAGLSGHRDAFLAHHRVFSDVAAAQKS